MFSPSVWGGSIRATCAAVAVAAIGTIGPAARAGIIVVDDFTETTLGWPFAQTTVGSSGLDEAGINVLGGSRHTTVTAESLAILGLDSVAIAIVPDPGIFDYTGSAGADGSFSLFYDGPAGNLNADLSSLAAFLIDLLLFDLGNGQPMPVTVTLDDGANTATGTAFVGTSGGQTLSMPFASFTGIESLNLTSVDSILFEFDPGLGNDLRLGAITVVPAPAGLALLAGAGLLGPRRRRRV